MPLQIVQCEVTWVVHVGYSGNELPPTKYESVGAYDSKEDAERSLTQAGFVRQPWGWKDSTGYGLAYVSRILSEIKPE